MTWDRYLGWLVLCWQREAGRFDPRAAAGWQAGSWRPDHEDHRAAERLAGLPTGQLTSLAELLDPPPRGGDPLLRTPDAGIDVDAALHAALRGEASAVQWDQLGLTIRADPSRAPRGEELDDLIRQLMSALPRGVKHAYRLMRVAALNIAAVPELCPQVISGIRACLADVDGPAFLEPIGLLDNLAVPEAHRLILDLMEQPRSRPQRRYAAGLATQVLIRGAFSDADRSRLLMLVVASWRADREVAEEDLGQLVDALPPGVGAALGRAVPSPAARDGADLAEDVDEPHRTRVSRAIAGRALRSWPGAPPADDDALASTLVDLVRQALFLRNAERRLRASLVLSASPLASGLGEGLLDLLAAPTAAAAVRRRAAAALNNMVAEQHVLRMIPHVEDGDLTVAASVTTAFGHTRPSDVADQAIRRRLPPDRLPLGRACLYALGMNGSPAITTLASSRTVPRWQRHTAQWWHENGRAIHA